MSHQKSSSKRRDGPHPLRHNHGGTDDEPLRVTAEEVEQHVLELRDHLLDQQQELDRREAWINSCLAALENERRILAASQRHSGRASRVELAADANDEGAAEPRERAPREGADPRQNGADASLPRDRELRLREAELEQRAAELDAEAERLAQRQRESERMLRQQRQSIDSERTQWQQQHAELIRSLDHQREQLQSQLLRLEQDRHLASSESDLKHRTTRLEHAERLIRQRNQQLDDERGQLDAARGALEQQRLDDQQQWTETRRAWDAEREREQRQCKLRSERLERRMALAKQAHEDVAQRHRELLELALAVQQWLAGIAEAEPPPQAQQQIAQLRRRLQEAYRQDREALAAQHAEIGALSKRLDAQQLALEQQREQVQRWTELKIADMESQAAQLVGRERELDSQHRLLQRQRETWEVERRQLQEQIRQLLIRGGRQAA